MSLVGVSGNVLFIKDMTILGQTPMTYIDYEPSMTVAEMKSALAEKVSAAPDDMRVTIDRVGKELQNESENGRTHTLSDYGVQKEMTLCVFKLPRAAAAEQSQALAPGASEELRKAFAMFDADGNGHIEAEELFRILVRGDSGLSMEIAESIVIEFDENGDGRLDVAEFIEAMMARAGAVDAVRAAAIQERREVKDAIKQTKLKLFAEEVLDVEPLIARAEKAGVAVVGLRALAASIKERKAASAVTSGRQRDGTLPGRPPNTILKVKTLTGKMISVPIDPAVDTVRDMMNALSAMEGIPADAIRLIWCGFTITDFPRFDGALESICGFGIDARGRLVGDRYTRTDLRMQFGEDGTVVTMVLILSKLR